MAAPLIARRRGVVPSKAVRDVVFADSPYAITADDDQLIVDATAGNVIISLPAVAMLQKAYLCRELLIKKVDVSAHTVTVTAIVGDLIDGAASIVLTSQYDNCGIINDVNQAAWWRIVPGGGGGGGTGITALTGDVTASGTGSVVATLANTAVTPASYGDSTHVGRFTVDAKGRLTAASSVAIAFPASTFTGSLAATQIAFGTGADVIGGSADLTWTAGSQTLAMSETLTVGSALKWSNTPFLNANGWMVTANGLVTIDPATSPDYFLQYWIASTGTAVAPSDTLCAGYFQADLTGPTDGNFVEGTEHYATADGSGTVSGDCAAIYANAGTGSAFSGTVSVPLTSIWAWNYLGGTGTVSKVIGYYYQAPLITVGILWSAAPVVIAQWTEDLSGVNATNKYAYWYDSPGVYRIKGDGVMAYYNPAFTPKYTPAAVNFERVRQEWIGDVATYGTEAGGTGVQRVLNLVGSDVQANGVSILGGGATGELLAWMAL